MQCRQPSAAAGRMLSLEQLTLAVQEHLGLYTDGVLHPSKWIVGESSLSGRGLIAVEDILPGEVIFVDHPLLYGPRSGSNIERGCSICSKIDKSLFKCHKCSILLCSEECQSTATHYKDCALITRWHNKVPMEEVDTTTLSKSLASIRVLLLDEQRKQFVASLQAHYVPPHGIEIEHLKKYFDIPEDEAKLMMLASCVLDANAYQIANAYCKKDMNMRGLYPVAALMNHVCVPNTRHVFNADNQMTVKAVKLIRAGSEILTCYTGLLWGTPARRAHLYKTKHFMCHCDRCADPTESGTLLAALKCFATECPGILLPIQPLRTSTAWRCLECDLKVPAQNIAAVQGALGSMMGTLDFKSLKSMEKFLTERIIKFIPKTNQIVVDLQCRLIWLLGETEGYRWHELSEEHLDLKESMCRGSLRTAAALGAGDAYPRGLLLYHLHAVLAERARRAPDLYEELRSEIESTLEEAYGILHGDVSAPPDLELRRRYLGPGSENPKGLWSPNLPN